MKPEVIKGIDGIQHQFPGTVITVRDDDQGGAYVIVEDVVIGEFYCPSTTWVGFHITALYPYADIYPIFIDGGVKRKDGVSFSAPITPRHTFEERAALQISRRNNIKPASGFQTVTSKILKILDYLEKLQ